MTNFWCIFRCPLLVMLWLHIVHSKENVSFGCQYDQSTVLQDTESPKPRQLISDFEQASNFQAASQGLPSYCKSSCPKSLPGTSQPVSPQLGSSIGLSVSSWSPSQTPHSDHVHLSGNNGNGSNYAAPSTAGFQKLPKNTHQALRSNQTESALPKPKTTDSCATGVGRSPEPQAVAGSPVQPSSRWRQCCQSLDAFPSAFWPYWSTADICFAHFFGRNSNMIWALRFRYLCHQCSLIQPYVVHLGLFQYNECLRNLIQAFGHSQTPCRASIAPNHHLGGEFKEQKFHEQIGPYSTSIWSSAIICPE